MKLLTQGRQLLFSTVRIETKSIRGEPVAAGTSFVFSDPDSDPGHELFLVSNKHMIESGWIGYLFFTGRGADGRPVVGSPFILKFDGFSSQWHGHPNPDVDVAVMPLSRQLDLIAKDNQEAFLTPIASADVSTEEDLEAIDIASPVLFVGYPNGMFDQKHYTPIVRQGFVATPPELDYDGEPVFLIDASVFPGSSGSPVFAYGQSWGGNVVNAKLHGVISAVYTQRTDGEIEWVPAPTNIVPVPSVDQMIDLGVVIKARLIRETIADFWRTSRGHAT